jgi:hypothetical protein
MHLSTGLVLRKTHLIVRDLLEVEHAETVESSEYRKEYGALAIAVRRGAERETLDVERIPGGRQRAAEIVRTIVRQRDLARRHGPAAAAVDVDESNRVSAAMTPIELPETVVIGRGVATWVGRHGRRLYVWTEETGPRFVQLRVTNEAPIGREFVRFDDVADFDLSFERGVTWPRVLYLGRRWFGLRPGVQAATEPIGFGGAGP